MPIFKILSFGDSIRDGKYLLHSKFTKVLNLCANTHRECVKMVSLVLPEIGPGPNNITVSRLPEIKRLKIKKQAVFFDGIPQKLSEASIYDSRIFKAKKSFVLDRNLFFCREELLRLSPPLSMAFVFAPDRGKEFKSGFEKKMLARMKKGVSELEKRTYASGAKILSGLGFGLTPSGDDFLGGILLAMNFFPGSGNSVKNIKTVLNNCKTSNPVSRSSLENYAAGKADLKVKSFLKSLGSGNRRTLKKSFGELAERGRTSGADFLSGFLFRAATSRHPASSRS